MKKLLALILAVAMLLSLVACGSKESAAEEAAPAETEAMEFKEEGLKLEAEISDDKTYRDHVNLSIWGPISDIDATFGLQNTVHRVYRNMVYNQLVYLNLETGEFEPELAAEWKAESMTSYYFKLRDDITFANGEPLTADDVLYSLYERPVNEATAERPAKVTLYTYIDNIEVINDYELRINLLNPDAEFLYKLYKGEASIFNREAVQADPEKGSYIGTGGWIPSDFVPSDYVTLEKVPTSWVWKEEGEIPTKTVTIKYMPENSVASCQAGEVANSLVERLGDLEGYLNADPNVETYTFAGLARIYFCFNVSENSRVYDDVNLRQAIAYAVDRQTFIDFATEGTSHVALSTWGEKQAGYFEDYEKPYGYDLEYAKQLMAQSKHPDGLHLRIICLQNRAEQATLVAEMLKELNITCDVTPLDTTAMAAYREAGTDYDIFLTDDTYGMNISAKENWWATGAKNTGSHYNDPRAIELFQQMVGAETEEERLAAAKEMQLMEKEQCVYVPICYMMTGVMWHTGVSGLDWSIDTYFDFHRVTWEEI